MNTEMERMGTIISEMLKADETGSKFVFDRKTKTLRTIPRFRDPDDVMEATAEDFGFSCEGKSKHEVIVISSETLQNMEANQPSQRVFFRTLDNGDVYSLIGVSHSQITVPGSINIVDCLNKEHVSGLGTPDDHVRVIVQKTFWDSFKGQTDVKRQIAGFVRRHNKWKEVQLQVVPIKDRLFSRFGGILETDAVSGKPVAVFGLGSFGSVIGIEEAKSGVTDLDLMDDDRLEIDNISRHAAGISHLGRYKVNAMNDLIHNINPYAEVQVNNSKVSWDNIEIVRKSVKRAAIVICTIDETPGRLITNRLCVEENTPCIFAGAFRRAYGGQVFFVRPGVSPCYQCFLMSIPDSAKEMEISNRARAQSIAYSDRPVAIEPGLSNDIEPICNMVVKLTIQELLKGTQTSLRSLDEDLVAPWYIWLNRREMGTQYEKLSPLEYNVDGMHILRWYGIDMRRHEACPVCGHL